MGSVRVAIVVASLAALLAAPLSADGSHTAVRLFHNTFDTTYRNPGGAVPAGSTVTLRLRVTGAKVRSAALHVEGGDPIGGAIVFRNVAMRKRGALWTVAYRTPSRPVILKYSFRVRTTRGTYWYGDDNSSDDSRKGGTGATTRTRGDGFQLTVYAPSFTTPSWLQGAVVYEIFADRFRNGDQSNDYCRSGSTTGCPVFYGNTQATIHQTWNEPVEDARATGVFNRDFFGGDLRGIEQKLDYLKSLGVDAIWLTPIFDARSNHRYDTADYMHVDPSLGGDAAFASLAAAAHARGIRLILDGVFNHTSSDSLYFDRYHRYADVGACESPTSPYRGWYEITGSDVPCTTYADFAGLDTLPQLDHSSAAVRDFMYRGSDSVVRHWLTRGADGWRLDAAQEVDHSWWRDFRAAVKGYAPDAPLVGEVTAGPTDASAYLVGNELDGVMNYRFRQAVDGYARLTNFTDSSGTIAALRPSQLDHSLHAILEDYPRAATAASFDLIDSHDTNRALFTLTEPGDPLGTARERQRLAALLQFTWVGAPMIYYGDEVGINAPGRNGFGDPYNRAPYPWLDATGNISTYGPPDDELQTSYAAFARMRRFYPALRRGGFTTLLTGDTTRATGDNDIYAFLRSGGGDKPVVVVVNKASSVETARIPLRGAFPGSEPLVDVVKSPGVNVVLNGGVAVVTMPARSGAVLVR
jgi:glycosidase